MASEAVLSQKKAFVAELSERLKSSCVGILVDYKGINSSEETELRKNLREKGSSYFVVKNTLASKAVEIAELSGLRPSFKGPTAISLSENDYSYAAKILADFSEKNENFKLKAGFVDGKVIDVEDIKSLAKLPSKEELVASLARVLNAPVAGLATVLKGMIRSLAIVLNAVAEKQN